MNNTISQDLDDLILRALRTGMPLEDVFQLLTSKAQMVSQSGPIVQAVLDARTTNGGQYL